MKLLALVAAFAVLATAHPHGGKGGPPPHQGGNPPPPPAQNGQQAPASTAENQPVPEQQPQGQLGGGHKGGKRGGKGGKKYNSDGTPCSSSSSEDWSSSDSWESYGDGYNGCFFFKGFIIAMLCTCLLCCVCKKMRRRGRGGRCGRKRRRCCGCRRNSSKSQEPNTVAMPRVVTKAEGETPEGTTVVPASTTTPGEKDDKDTGITAVVVDYEDSIESQEQNKEVASHVV